MGQGRPSLTPGCGMKLTVILAVSFLLASLPLVIAAFFRIFTLPRKVLALTADVQKLEGTGDGNISAGQDQPAHVRKYAAPDISALAKKYFASSTLAIPSALLTVLYFAGFLLC